MIPPFISNQDLLPFAGSPVFPHRGITLLLGGIVVRMSKLTPVWKWNSWWPDSFSDGGKYYDDGGSNTPDSFSDGGKYYDDGGLLIRS